MESTAPRHLAEPGEGPASPGTVDAALAAVTALLPGGGEARAGQVAMAEAVATARARPSPGGLEEGVDEGCRVEVDEVVGLLAQADQLHR